ncbi:MAG: DinB family protein [Pirellulaceae bacterium]
MIDYLKQIVAAQFEASLCMLNDCVQKCPAESWPQPVGSRAFWFVAYHALCYTDLYLSPSDDEFELRDFHTPEDDQPFIPAAGIVFSQQLISDYLAICRRKAGETLAAETDQSLRRESGFPWLPFTRGELHLYNLRHLQHHTGQLSAVLRRLGLEPRWVGSGWR